jgi:hypothetical protein
MKCTSETRNVALQIHEALMKARVPGYLEAYESFYDNRLSGLTEVMGKLEHLVHAGIQALRKNFAR